MAALDVELPEQAVKEGVNNVQHYGPMFPNAATWVIGGLGK